MGKYCREIFIFAVALMLTTGTGDAAKNELYEKLSRKSNVKVFVAEFSNETKGDKVLLPDLKEQVEEELKNRKSIKFNVVSSRSDADIAVEGEVVEYFWTDKDPIDMIVGLGATAMDAVTQEPYVRMQAKLRVVDAKSSAVLWKDKLMATVTKSGMTEAEGPARVNEDMAKGFTRTAFGKKRA